jgi:16S rRNA (cytosine967-C5)-methyltransferase
MAQNSKPTAGPMPQNAVPVRLVALELLHSILEDDTNMDHVFGAHKGFAAFNALDRALVRMMVATTLRRLGQIDDFIKMAFDRDDAPTPPLLLSLLRLSVAQIMFMNMPNHAAVHVAVDVAVDAGLSRQKGLVNAILRRVTRDGPDHLSHQDSARLNTPDWMMKDWRTHFGAKAAMATAEILLTEAPLDLTLRDPKTSAHYANVLGGEILTTGTLRIQNPSGTIESMPGFIDGAWWVQDAAASLPVRLMGNVTNKHIVDLCAAPGGKTAQLASAGAHVTAVDHSLRRLNTLKSNLNRLALEKNVTSLVSDATTWQPKAPVDIVLIDAPCTATGTIRRNPDIPVHRAPDDTKRMAKIQADLLDNATTLIKPDGAIYYAVCSLQYAEGEGQIKSFLKTHPDFAVDPFTPTDLPGIDPFVTKEGYIRVLPHLWADQGGIDGFFIARVVRAT